jgi:hypothetical protein
MTILEAAQLYGDFRELMEEIYELDMQEMYKIGEYLDVGL